MSKSLSTSAVFLVLTALMCIFYTANCYIDEAIEDCFDEDLQISVKNGESIQPAGLCQRLTCFGDGFLHVEQCRNATRPGCKMFEADVTKEYPMCCPHMECSDKAELFEH